MNIKFEENNVLNFKYASFHLNKNHIQAKFKELAKWREAAIHILLVYLDY